MDATAASGPRPGASPGSSGRVPAWLALAEMGCGGSARRSALPSTCGRATGTAQAGVCLVIDEVEQLATGAPGAGDLIASLVALGRRPGAVTLRSWLFSGELKRVFAQLRQQGIDSAGDSAGIAGPGTTDRGEG